MTNEEQERLQVLAELMDMSLEEATDLIGEMTVADVLRMRLQQQEAVERTAPDYDAVFSAFLEALSTTTTSLLEAIKNSTTATQDVLERLETVLSENGTPAFEVPKEILGEGKFLKEQLAGVVSTETPGPRFKDATPQSIPPGLAVLAASVREDRKSA